MKIQNAIDKSMMTYLEDLYKFKSCGSSASPLEIAFSSLVFFSLFGSNILINHMVIPYMIENKIVPPIKKIVYTFL